MNIIPLLAKVAELQQPIEHLFDLWARYVFCSSLMALGGSIAGIIIELGMTRRENELALREHNLNRYVESMWPKAGF